ncbi:MAG: sulfur carrier protein ThiS [Candidatus Latescibacteria bacterium]|nr:sulfur carrier protein ThiS [Candidatus Latescibacterota bacterium]
MTVTVNGTVHEFDRAMSMADLLCLFDIKSDGIAVALNASVVHRQDLSQMMLRDGDIVEIIRAVAGG